MSTLVLTPFKSYYGASEQLGFMTEPNGFNGFIPIYKGQRPDTKVLGYEKAVDFWFDGLNVTELPDGLTTDFQMININAPGCGYGPCGAFDLEDCDPEEFRWEPVSTAPAPYQTKKGRIYGGYTLYISLLRYAAVQAPYAIRALVVYDEDPDSGMGFSNFLGYGTYNKEYYQRWTITFSNAKPKLVYEPINWKDYPDKTTPINAENLNHIDDALYNATERINDFTYDLTTMEDRLVALPKNIPTTDGTYQLKCKVVSGKPTFVWET